jgi:class 3 adenylate cyclase
MNGRSAVLAGPSNHAGRLYGGQRRPPGVAFGRATAQARGALLQSFKIHAAVYVPINVLLSGIWAAAGGGYFWPVWSILGWGVGLACHAAPLLARSGFRQRATKAQRRAEEPRSPERSKCVDGAGATITEERPKMRSVAAPDGTVTILFSDIETSTALNERLGDVRWMQLLRMHHATVREQVREHGGYEVKAQGDGFMIAFASAGAAVRCARAIQRDIDSRLGQHPDGPVRLRIGLHTGEAIKDEADFYGRNVALAARLTDQAHAGEILASSVVKQLTESAGDVHFDDGRELELEGLSGMHTVYRVI